MPNKRVLLLVNASSRRGAQAHDQARERLAALGLDVIDPYPSRNRDFGALIARARGEADVAVLGGGDGTLNSAIEGLLESGLPLGILPLGTANNLARSLGIPGELEQACEVIARGKEVAVDLGSVNGHYFLNCVGIGISAAINQSVPRNLKKKWGMVAYAVTAFRKFRARAPFEAEIECDGRRTRVRSIQISVCNGKHFGSALTIAEDASADDGMLDLVSAEIDGLASGVVSFSAMLKGEQDRSRYLRFLRGREITVRTNRPLLIDADGEITTRTPADFRVHEKAIRILVPEEAASGTVKKTPAAAWAAPDLFFVSAAK